MRASTFKTFLRVTGTLGLLSAAGLSHAAATLLEEGELSYAVNVAYITSTEFFTDNGNKQDIGCHAKYGEYTHDFEYGYSPFYTWLLSASLGVTSCDDPGDQGLDDVKLGFRAALPALKDAKSKSAITVLASIPADPDAKRETGASRLSCGTFTVSAALDHSRLLSERTTANYGAGFLLSEAPLAHQANANLSLDRLLSERWGMKLGLAANAPITQVPSETDATNIFNSIVARCGTESSAVNATLGLTRKLSKSAQAGCGGVYTVWGEDTVQALGAFCSYTFTWK